MGLSDLSCVNTERPRGIVRRAVALRIQLYSTKEMQIG